MPTQSNYDHIKSELLEAKKTITELEKKIKEYKEFKKVTFSDIKVHVEEVDDNKIM